MDDLQKKLTWLLVIFPGFVTVTVIGSIVDLGDVGDLSLTFYSLALTFVDVVIAVLMTAALVGILAAFGVSLQHSGKMLILLAATLVVSIVVGVVLGIASERGTFYEWLRKIPYVDVLNKRSQARPLIFLLRRNSGGLLDIEGDGRPGKKVGEAYLRVYLDGGVIYEGWPEFYDAKPTEIYLSPGCKIVEQDGRETKASQIEGPGVIIPESQIKHAILLERNASPCWHLYFPETSKPAQ